MNDAGVTQDAPSRSHQVIRHCKGALRKSTFGNSALDHATLMMLARMLELQRAMHALLEHDLSAAVATIVLARAQYEMFLNFSYILLPVEPEKRDSRARDYIAFAEYEFRKLLGDDRQAYRASLSDAEPTHFDRRMEIAADVEQNLTAKQREQRWPTWNGLTIAKTAREVDFQKEHHKWYPIMCGVAHGSPSMAHKSITITPTQIMLCQEDHGRADSADWLERAATTLFVATQKFLWRRGELSDEQHERDMREVLGRGVNIGQHGSR